MDGDVHCHWEAPNPLPDPTTIKGTSRNATQSLLASELPWESSLSLWSWLFDCSTCSTTSMTAMVMGTASSPTILDTSLPTLLPGNALVFPLGTLLAAGAKGIGELVGSEMCKPAGVVESAGLASLLDGALVCSELVG